MDKNEHIIERQREAFREFMHKHKLKAFSWAKKSGVADSTIRNYLNGLNQSLTGLVLEKLASSIGFEINDLIGKQKLPNNCSLNRDLLIQSFIKSEELIVKSALTIPAKERVNILLAWYDLAQILEQEEIEHKSDQLSLKTIDKVAKTS